LSKVGYAAFDSFAKGATFARCRRHRSSPAGNYHPLGKSMRLIFGSSALARRAAAQEGVAFARYL
jgi:hypothetical protein